MVYRFVDFLENLILGMELASFSDKNPDNILVIYKITVLDRKRSIKRKHVKSRDEIEDISWLTKIFFKNYKDILGKMVWILEFLLDFLSRNDASSIPRIWIFCPEFKYRDYQ